MQNEINMVIDFQTAFEFPVRKEYNYPPIEMKELNLRSALITEEAKETIEKGVQKDDDVEFLDGLCDLLYVTAGTAAQLGLDPDKDFKEVCCVLLDSIQNGMKTYLIPDNAENINKGLCLAEILIRGIAAVKGFPFDEAFAEVHRSNMSKWQEKELRQYNEQGKVLKPDHYSPADIKGILATSNYKGFKADV